MATKYTIQTRYQEQVVPALMQEFKFDNVMQVPRIEKIVINIGAGDAIENAKTLDGAVSDLRQITGQQPVITKALPRIRDFRGVSPDTFDGRGNYTIGLREQLMFPEIQYDKIDKVRGMEITIVTTAKNDEEGRRLLKLLGMPFRER